MDSSFTREQLVELIHSHTTTQSHWSSGWTVLLPTSYVSVVLLHWWPWHDPWSPASIGSLTLATGCFSHPSCPSSILTAGLRLMWHATRIPQGPEPLPGGRGGWGSLVELLHSHTTTQSHWSSGSTVCFPPRGAVLHVPGMHPHFWHWDSPLSVVLVQTIIFFWFQAQPFYSCLSNAAFLLYCTVEQHLNFCLSTICVSSREQFLMFC